MTLKRAQRLGLRSALVLVALCGVGYLILLLTAIAAAGPHTVQQPCGPAGAQTIRSSSSGRIYRVRARPRPFYDVSYYYYGCAAGQAKPYLLGFTNAQSRIRQIKLLGTTAGFIIDQTGVDYGGSTLTVVDLANRHVLHTVIATYMVPGSSDTLVTYVLGGSGNIAWVTVSSNTFSGGPQKVTVLNAIGRMTTTLDRGKNIRAGSLRLRGHVLRWLHGQQQRHAVLP